MIRGEERAHNRGHPRNHRNHQRAAPDSLHRGNAGGLQTIDAGGAHFFSPPRGVCGGLVSSPVFSGASGVAPDAGVPGAGGCAGKTFWSSGTSATVAFWLSCKARM